MIATELRAAGTALAFLTRIPGPAGVGAEDVARAGAYFPLVGAGVGALSGVVLRRLGPAAGLAAGTVLTGALHLDALADSADSLGAGPDRERALEIMADSRIGSFGTAAVCLDLMVKAAALERTDRPLRALLRAGALSRAVPVVLSAALPYARPGGGTGAALASGSGERAAVAAALGILIAADPGSVLVAATVTVAAAAFWRRRLGGVTGDALGASLELSETAVLLWQGR